MLTSERTFRNLLLSFTLGIAPLFVLPAHAGRPVDAFVTTPHHLACSDLLAHINYQDLVVRSKEGRASLDATLANERLSGALHLPFLFTQLKANTPISIRSLTMRFLMHFRQHSFA